jgi:membrane-associated phospholipid phosphatase
MIETLKQLDTQWLLAINVGLKSTFLDMLCPFMRTQSYWYPLYALMLVLSYRKWGHKVWWILLSATLLIVISDQLSANLIKNTVQRLRPCNEPLLKGTIYNIVGCGKGYSFISAHATNHFAIGIFFSFIFRTHYTWMLYVALLWAGLISFSQVYVGVHYPIDVICGALLGSMLGYFAARIVSTKFLQPHT